MDFTRRSNLSSLVPALLVALLALAANYYVRMAPRMVPRERPPVAMVKHLSGGRGASSRDEPAPRAGEGSFGPSAADASNATVSEQLRGVEKRMTLALKHWQQKGTAPSAASLQRQVALAEKIVQRFQEDPDREPGADLLALERRLLKIRFIAAELAPEQFSTEFLAEADAFIARHDDDTAAPIVVLRLIHRQHVDPLENADLLETLQAFSFQYPDPRLGTSLYALMADDLYRRGYIDLAFQVLRQGMQLYRGEPSVGRLVNLLVDLQRRRPSGPSTR